MFKKLDINQERELEALVIKDIQAVEEGLVYLDHQKRANGKFIDVLASDRDGVLVVMELKLGEDDGMLVQSLEYYDYVSINRDRLAKSYEKKAHIVTEEDPRIILVAASFSDRLKKAARYFEPTVSLREYSYLGTTAGERGLYCKEVPFESDSAYGQASSIDSVFAYINLQKVKDACMKAHANIRVLGPDIEVVTRGSKELRYKCKNRLVGGLWVARTFFHVWWWTDMDQDEWDSAKLTSLSDWSTRKKKILKVLEKCYHELGGT